MLIFKTKPCWVDSFEMQLFWNNVYLHKKWFFYNNQTHTLTKQPPNFRVAKLHGKWSHHISRWEHPTHGKLFFWMIPEGLNHHIFSLARRMFLHQNNIRIWSPMNYGYNTILTIQSQIGSHDNYISYFNIQHKRKYTFLKIMFIDNVLINVLQPW
jgi:hypothetical protein